MREPSAESALVDPSVRLAVPEARSVADPTPVARGGPVVDHAARLAAASSAWERVELSAELILDVFDRFYAEFVRLTWEAKTAFETRDHAAAVANARTRLGSYNATVYALADELRAAFPELKEHQTLWAEVGAVYRAAIHGRYEADLALAYLHSAQRVVHQDEWKPVEYGFDGPRPVIPSRSAVYERFTCAWPVDPLIIQRALRVADLAVPFADPAGDAERIARRLNDVLAGRSGAGLRAIEMVRAGFFRNRGAYLFGRLRLKGTELRPFVIALLNDEAGVHAEALLHAATHVHNLSSSTEAPFQVTNLHYHELAAFLHSIMPRRPLGLHYSSFGFYHYSKVAVMNECAAAWCRSGSGWRWPWKSRHRHHRIHLAALGLHTEGDPRPADERLQVGQFRRSGGGARQVPARARDQPHRKHARQPSLLQSQARARMV